MKTKTGLLTSAKTDLGLRIKC